MTRVKIFFGAWFVFYLVYSHFKLNGLVKYINEFYEADIISLEVNESFKKKYTGLFRYYQSAPNREQYPFLFENQNFRRFCKRVWFLDRFFIITGFFMFLSLILF